MIRSEYTYLALICVFALLVFYTLQRRMPTNNDGEEEEEEEEEGEVCAHCWCCGCVCAFVRVGVDGLID